MGCQKRQPLTGFLVGCRKRKPLTGLLKVVCIIDLMGFRKRKVRIRSKTVEICSSFRPCFYLWNPAQLHYQHVLDLLTSFLQESLVYSIIYLMLYGFEFTIEKIRREVDRAKANEI